LPLVEGWSAQSPRDNLNTVFRFETAQPTIANRRVYVASARVPVLQVHRLTDGVLLARHPLPAPVLAPLAPAGDLGLVMADSEGRLSLVSEEGGEVWQTEVSGGVAAPMRVLEGRVVVQTLTQTVHLFDLETKEQVWTYLHEDSRPTSAPPPVFGGARPLAWPGGVLAGFSDGSLVNLDRESGEVLWSLRVAEGDFPDVAGDPLWVEEHQSLILSSYSGPLVAIDPETKTERWRLELGGLGAPAVERKLLYVADPQASVHAIDVESGVEQWTFELPKGPGGGVVVRSGLVFVSDRHGTLHALDRFTGELRWSWRPGFIVSGIWHPPAVDDTWFLLHSNEGRIQAMHHPWLPQNLSSSQGERRFRPLGG
jgi:hypothetical protein